MSFLSAAAALEKLAETDIRLEPLLCSRVRFARSQCEDCLRGCPEGALSWDKTLQLAEGKCTGCGLCISRCPNGVFESLRYSDFALTGEIASFLAGSGRKAIVFGCARGGPVSQDVFILPCLGRLTENLLIAPFIFRANLVEIWLPECHGCANENCLSHLEAVLLLSKKLTATAGLGEDVIKVRRCGLYAKHMPDVRPRLSRRRFLRDLTKEAGQALIAPLPDFDDEKPPSPWAHTVGAKRLLLLKLVKALPQNNPTRIERKGLPVAEVEIHGGCVGCPVCATLCPTGALERMETAEGVDIYFRPEICAGCQICQEACLFQAISLSTYFDLAELAVGQRRHLTHLTRIECRECGADFAGIDNETCPACRLKQGEIALPSMGRKDERCR